RTAPLPLAHQPQTRTVADDPRRGPVRLDGRIGHPLGGHRLVPVRPAGPQDPPDRLRQQRRRPDRPDRRPGGTAHEGPARRRHRHRGRRRLRGRPHREPAALHHRPHHRLLRGRRPVAARPHRQAAVRAGHRVPRPGRAGRGRRPGLRSGPRRPAGVPGRPHRRHDARPPRRIRRRKARQMTREDLLALTPEGLAALANRGLVKRAAKELDAGAAPELDIAADGAVRAVFPDGTETTLPAEGGLERAVCSCAAVAKCRHRIVAVLAYQRRHESGETAAPAVAEAHPSPAAVTDEQLREAFGRHVLTAAEKARRAGYTARLTWPAPERPAVAELATCTVSFLVPGRLGYVHTDATGPARETAIVLAVWAFREAETAEPAPEPAATRPINVGGEENEADLSEAVALSERVLLEGVESVDGVLTAALTREADALAKRRLHWPAGAVRDLIDQVRRYHNRSASYEPQRFAALLAELPARARAAGSPEGTPNSQILGSDEVAQTPLALVRLTGLGCRIGTDGERRTAELFLAHPETGMVLTVARDWEIPEGQTLTGRDLAGRRLAGCRIGALASGNVVSEAAGRTAARALKLGTGRLAKTQVLPLGRAWSELPANLLVTDLDAAAAELNAMPPSMIRPRVAAELVRVVCLDQVES